MYSATDQNENPRTILTSTIWVLVVAFSSSTCDLSSSPNHRTAWAAWSSLATFDKIEGRSWYEKGQWKIIKGEKRYHGCATKEETSSEQPCPPHAHATPDSHHKKEPRRIGNYAVSSPPILQHNRHIAERDNITNVYVHFTAVDLRGMISFRHHICQ